MNTMLSSLDFVFTYLDDILIKSGTNQQHFDYIQNIFKRIESFGFRLSDEKCAVLMTSIKYLRQNIDSNGRRPDPRRIHCYQKYAFFDERSRATIFMEPCKLLQFLYTQHELIAYTIKYIIEKRYGFRNSKMLLKKFKKYFNFQFRPTSSPS